MTSDDLQRESIELLQELIRFDTVNPPGRERAAIEHLERYVGQAGFDTQVLFQWRDNGYHPTGTVPRFYAELESRGIAADQAVFR